MVSHLFFADDSLLFFDASKNGASWVKGALDLYSKASGQMINFEKSALTFNQGAKQSVVNDVHTIFGVPVVSSHSIYLGLPTFVMKNRRLQFDYLADRAAKKVGNWMRKSFSAGGKEVLIKSVIQAIPTYTMACFRIPVSVCNNIERVCARFWWGDKEKEKHMHWMTWKEMCKPKSHGGMGFRSLVEFNQALLAKQIWRIVKYPLSLVARLMKAKYFRSTDIMQAKVQSNCSYLWRSLLWGRELLEKGVMWRIGDGAEVRIFEDAWLPSFHMGRTIQRSTGQVELRVAELLNTDGSWNDDKLQDILLLVEAEGVMRLSKLSHQTNDVRYWKFDERGEYSVKSGYLVATGFFDVPSSSSADESRRWWKFLWSFDLPPRVRVFAWRAVRNIIPTELNLAKHHVPILGGCGWCSKEWGSTAHVLLYCEKVRQYWHVFDCWEVLKKWEGFSLWEIGEALRISVPRAEFELWIMGMWLVWKALCDERYKGRSWPLTDLRREAAIHIESFSTAKQQAALAARVLPKEGGPRWLRPRRGRLRLDVDYAFDESRRTGGVGAIVRNDAGDIVRAMAKPIEQAVTTFHGELQALMHGIKLCVEWDLSPLEVYTDSILAVIAIEEEAEDSSVLNADYFDFFAMVKNLNVLSVNHVGREANKAAHELARLGRRLDNTLVWQDNWPVWLVDIVSDD